MTKKIIGKVISDKMQKTRIVITETLKKHLRYKKFYRHKTKYYVHDSKEKSKIGDWVIIKQSRPISKLKRWVLVDILNKDSFIKNQADLNLNQDEKQKEKTDNNILKEEENKNLTKS